jgi:acyl-CoA synthetase (NDP forming)
MARFSPAIAKELASYLPHEASVKNPVDMIAGATPEMYRKCLKAIIRDKNVDAIIVLNVPLVLKAEIETAQAVVDVGRFSSKPILACFLGKKEDSPGVRHMTENNIPTYRFPESAVKAMRMLFNYGQWRKKDKGEVTKFKVNKKKAMAQINKAKKEGRPWLNQREVRDVLDAYGFKFTKTYLAKDEDEAVVLAKKMNFPVVLKVESPDVIHKWDVGGVALDLHNEREVRRAFKQIMKSVRSKVKDAKINGIRVEEMITKGKEVIIGMSLDPIYGPLIMYGLGGIYVETFKDVAFRLIPLTDVDATEMLEETKGSALLKGARGEKAADVKTLSEWLQRLAQLVTDMHDIAELDMNPVMVMPKGNGCLCVDARIKLVGEDAGHH